MKWLVGLLLFVVSVANAQTVTTQTAARLTSSDEDPQPFVPLILDATDTAEPLTPALSVPVPNAQAPRLMTFVSPAIAIPFNSRIRQVEAFWNGRPLPLIDPRGTLLVEEAHAFGPMLPFFKPLFSLNGIAPGPGTLEVRAFDTAHAPVASVSIPSLSIVAPPAPVATATIGALPHPRIYLTRERLGGLHVRGVNDVARSRYAASLNYFLTNLVEQPDVTSPDFENRVYDPESYIPLLSLTYQLNQLDNPQLAARAAAPAKTLALRIANAYDTGGRDFGRDTGYDIRFGLRNLMLAYDWMHDELTDAERALIVKVATKWVDWYHTTPGYAESQPVENYYAGYLQGLALTAVATAGENPDADRIFTLLRFKLANEVPMMNQRLAGGDWAEGWNYGPYSAIELNLVNVLLRDLGEDWTPVFDWVQALPLSMTYQIAPNFSETRSYGGYSGDYPSRTSAAMLAVLSTTTTNAAYAQRLYASTNANPDNDFTDIPGDAFYDMIFAPTTQTAVDVGALPLSYLNTGTGRFFSRSSLTDPNAYFASAENIGYSFDHYGYANGDVRLYHGDECLVCPSAYRGDAFDGEAVTPAFSTYLVNDRDQQIVLGRNNQNVFTIERGNFSAIGMRFESSWTANRYDEGIVDPSNPLDYMIREAVHLRPGTLIVRDVHRRRHSGDTLTAFFHLGSFDAPQTVRSGVYRFGMLNVSTFYPGDVALSFSDDKDGGNNRIGTLMRVQFPAGNTQPFDIVTVFSETLTATSYTGGVLTLSDGTRVTFANGTVTVAATNPPRRRAARH